MASRPCPLRSTGCTCEKCEGMRKYARDWARAHHDPVKAKARRKPKDVEAARMRAWSRKNRERLNARRNAAYAKDPAAGAAQAKAWRQKNPLRAALVAARYKAKHPNAIREWQDRHPDRYLAKRARDRADRKANGHKSAGRHGYGAPVGLNPLFAKIATCGLCFLPIYSGVMVRALKFTRDHIKPVSLGGKHDPSNLQPAHATCNASKRDKEDVSLFWIRAVRLRVLAYFRKEVAMRRAG